MLGMRWTYLYYGIGFGSNPYLDNIETAYFENLDLYHKLLTQIRGDAAAEEDLRELKYEYETRLTEI